MQSIHAAVVQAGVPFTGAVQGVRVLEKFRDPDPLIDPMIRPVDHFAEPTSSFFFATAAVATRRSSTAASMSAIFFT